MSLNGLGLAMLCWILFSWARTLPPGEDFNSKVDIPKPEVPSAIYTPIPFSQRRIALTLEYIKKHYDPEAADIYIEPEMIVVHWSASPAASSVLSTFGPETLPIWRLDLVKGGKVNVSAHFLVDRDGIVYQLMPTNWMARHVIGLNRVAIGIENVGGPEMKLNDRQARANARLIRQLLVKYPAIKYLIGHHEYLGFRGSPLWRENDASYLTRKQDPGPEFMTTLRDLLKDTNLAAQYSSPEN